jgi:hypothetical protein
LAQSGVPAPAISVNVANNPDCANGSRVRALYWLYPGYKLN